LNPVTGKHETAIGEWHPPAKGDDPAGELLVSFYETRAIRVLVLPAWFDEANRMRRFTIEVMRRLHGRGIDSLLPDLPGCNESLAPMEQQTLPGWREAAVAAAQTYGATHVLAIRAGALIAPTDLPGWHYAAQSGPKLLRGMIRARTIAAREAGWTETSEELMALGRTSGLELAGWPLGAALFAELEQAEPQAATLQRELAQSELGGAGLWLRAEPDENAAQADALANIIASEAGLSE
jgi:hypothetical protein